VAPSKNTEREAREARDRLRRYNARQSVHTHQVKRRSRDNVIALVALVVVAALATVTQIYYFSSGPGAPKVSPSASASPSPSASSTAGSNVGAVPPTTLGGDKIWTGSLTLNSTKLGISLNGNLAPQAVSSVVNDIQTKFLVGKACWRLANTATAHLIQCGGSSGSDTGGSPYNFGPLENVPKDNVYPAGSIVLARLGGDAYGEGHQFFIVYASTKLDPDSAGGYSIVGTVTSGLAQLQSNIVAKGISGGLTDGAPNVATKITSVTIK
jgi:peptidyl-prolyl cis-trans isomerase B (cyclophilin B)